MRLYSAATALRESIGAPLWPAEREAQQRSLDELRRVLGEGDFASAWADGKGMSTDSAVSLALDRALTAS